MFSCLKDFFSFFFLSLFHFLLVFNIFQVYEILWCLVIDIFMSYVSVFCIYCLYRKKVGNLSEIWLKYVLSFSTCSSVIWHFFWNMLFIYIHPYLCILKQTILKRKLFGFQCGSQNVVAIPFFCMQYLEYNQLSFLFFYNFMGLYFYNSESERAHQAIVN